MIDYLQLAIELAFKARPSPNPRVGAVIVKNEVVIGKGFHAKCGELHAEVNAINSVRDKSLLRGATLYVTLEPCSHLGKTPPCTDLIIASGISKVVIGSIDANPLVFGVKTLREKGITCEFIDNNECKVMNEAFFYWIKTKTPFIFLKMAMTLDGKIATANGCNESISNEKSHALSNSWRGEYDAILVGVNTILNDDPRLTNRTTSINPIRIILDSTLKIPLDAKVLQPTARRIIATTVSHDKKKKLELEANGVDVLIVKDDAGKVDLKDLLAQLGKMNVTSILVEGGSQVASSFVQENLVKKAAFFIAPRILGNGINAFNLQVGKMSDAVHLKDVKTTKIDDDVLLEGYF